MKVVSIGNCGKYLSEKALALGNTRETKHNLKIGTTYIVYGMTLWNDVLHYLLVGEEIIMPSWYPAELFNVSDNQLPVEWYFNYIGYSDEHSVVALWGYKELALNLDYYDDLIELEKYAVEIFQKRKKEIDECS